MFDGDNGFQDIPVCSLNVIWSGSLHVSFVWIIKKYSFFERNPRLENPEYSSMPQEASPIEIDDRRNATWYWLHQMAAVRKSKVQSSHSLSMKSDALTTCGVLLYLPTEWKGSFPYSLEMVRLTHATVMEKTIYLPIKSISCRCTSRQKSSSDECLESEHSALWEKSISLN